MGRLFAYNSNNTKNKMVFLPWLSDCIVIAKVQGRLFNWAGESTPFYGVSSIDVDGCRLFLLLASRAFFRATKKSGSVVQKTDNVLIQRIKCSGWSISCQLGQGRWKEERAFCLCGTKFFFSAGPPHPRWLSPLSIQYFTGTGRNCPICSWQSWDRLVASFTGEWLIPETRLW